ncbi:MAG: ATP-binding protein, partial [Candidatus Daviesbacteria bacterium]|nr:ATP-binding protein [Candidatus Daviesbacteria bacterium]
KGKAKLTTKLADTLFKCFDLLEEMVDDQSKKVDLEPYLKELQISSETERSAGVELATMFQKKLATIRVKMEDLDSLVNLVGELVIAKMQLDQTALITASDEAKYVLTAIGRSISDLQDQAMRLRLVPIEEILNRFPRMVRDLSKNQGKEIKLEMNSFGIELDRTILDAITDPLLHILRNAIDHGIESPSERKKIGKPKSAIIKITASRVGDKVVLRIEDDGRGIDVDRIRSMAIKNKILSGAEANSITDDEILSLLGTPGLSGASNVTDVSGRGVGFNVVRRQVEDVGGQVSIETKKSHGTSIMITIPLSLAIIEGLLVTAAEQKYVLPLSTITAILHIENHEIKSVHGTRTIVLRD